MPTSDVQVKQHKRFHSGSSVPENVHNKPGGGKTGSGAVVKKLTTDQRQENTEAFTAEGRAKACQAKCANAQLEYLAGVMEKIFRTVGINARKLPPYDQTASDWCEPDADGGYPLSKALLSARSILSLTHDLSEGYRPLSVKLASPEETPNFILACEATMRAACLLHHQIPDYQARSLLVNVGKLSNPYFLVHPCLGVQPKVVQSVKALQIISEHFNPRSFRLEGEEALVGAEIPQEPAEQTFESIESFINHMTVLTGKIRKAIKAAESRSQLSQSQAGGSSNVSKESYAAHQKAACRRDYERLLEDLWGTLTKYQALSLFFPDNKEMKKDSRFSGLETRMASLKSRLEANVKKHAIDGIGDTRLLELQRRGFVPATRQAESLLESEKLQLVRQEKVIRLAALEERLEESLFGKNHANYLSLGKWVGKGDRRNGVLPELNWFKAFVDYMGEWHSRTLTNPKESVGKELERRFVAELNSDEFATAKKDDKRELTLCEQLTAIGVPKAVAEEIQKLPERAKAYLAAEAEKSRQQTNRLTKWDSFVKKVEEDQKALETAKNALSEVIHGFWKSKPRESRRESFAALKRSLSAVKAALEKIEASFQPAEIKKQAAKEWVEGRITALTEEFAKIYGDIEKLLNDKVYAQAQKMRGEEINIAALVARENLLKKNLDVLLDGGSENKKQEQCLREAGHLMGKVASLLNNGKEQEAKAEIAKALKSDWLTDKEPAGELSSLRASLKECYQRLLLALRMPRSDPAELKTYSQEIKRLRGDHNRLLQRYQLHRSFQGVSKPYRSRCHQLEKRIKGGTSAPITDAELRAVRDRGLLGTLHVQETIGKDGKTRMKRAGNLPLALFNDVKSILEKDREQDALEQLDAKGWSLIASGKNEAVNAAYLAAKTQRRAAEVARIEKAHDATQKARIEKLANLKKAYAELVKQHDATLALWRKAKQTLI